MKRRTALTTLLAAAALPSAASAQHHMMQSAPGVSDGKGVLLLAAATLKPALDPIVADWRAKNGVDVTIAYGPSLALAKQIENGAPADLFISADPQWTDFLADRKLIRRHTRADLVRNVLVLAGHEPSTAPAAIEIDRSFPLAQIVGPGPLAMCNPADHPAGRYGKAALESLGLWD